MNENDILLKVYIGQRINYNRGVLYKFKNKHYFSEKENEIINSLIEKKILDLVYPYSIK